MSGTARPEQIEFTAPEPGEVVDALRDLVVERRGWVNLEPEVESDAAEAVRPSFVAAVFRAAGPPIPSVTIVAPTAGRRPQPAQLGISHGVGTPVLRRLAAEGHPRPDEWKVVQDHARRGVVVRLPEDFDPADVLAWALSAAALLCPIETTGGWLAEVYRG